MLFKVKLSPDRSMAQRNSLINKFGLGCMPADLAPRKLCLLFNSGLGLSEIMYLVAVIVRTKTLIIICFVVLRQISAICGRSVNQEVGILVAQDFKNTSW